MDFFVRDLSTLIPIEVKATDNATKSHSIPSPISSPSCSNVFYTDEYK